MNIRDKRQALMLTQKQLADKLGASESTVSMIERGERRPSIKLARKIADLFGCEWWEVYE